MKWLLALVLVSASVLAADPVPTKFADYMISLTTYAAWDDSLYLMWDPTPQKVNDYIGLNLAQSVMKNMPLNFAGYYFPNGTSLFLRGFNYTSTGQTQTLAMPSFFANVPTNVVAKLNSSTEARFTDYTQYPSNNRTIMIAGCPIFHSDYTGPVGGFILYGLFEDLLPTHDQYFMNLVINFAVWDTSYEVIQSKNESLLYDFMSSNFAFNSMKNTLLNFAAYYFPDGTPFFTIGYDYTSATPYEQITMPEVYQEVPATVISNMGDRNYRYSAGFAYRNRYIDVVGCPILHTDGTGPVAGFALFARFRDTSQPLNPESGAAMYQISLLPMIIAIICYLLY